MKKIVYFLIFIAFFQFAAAQNGTRPNIIFILADDLGAGDLHCTGHPYAKTPNIDELADNGIRFENAYMAAAWCAPSRYGLMSGQYPARKFNKTHNLDPKEPCLTHLLKDSGYTTAHFGKWHLTTKNSTYAKSPSDFGIDNYFITEWKGEPIKETWSKEEKNKEFWRANSSDYYVDMAIDFIKKNKAKPSPKPFFMNLWLHATHSYIHPTPEQLSLYSGLKVDYKDFSPYQQKFLKFVAENGNIDKAMQAYCADITALDKALGRLFAFLKQNHLDKNTLIVFTSDNGPGPLTKQIKSGSIIKRYKEKPDLLNSVGSAKIYKERKLSLNEGGIRVPFIVNWPNKIPKGLINNTTNLQGVDFLLTILSIAKVKLPKDGTFDGMDMSDAFFGKKIKRKSPLFWSERHSSAILMNNMKGYLNDDEFELYNLKNDPSQLVNLKYKKNKTAIKLELLLKEWLHKIGKE